MTLANVSKQKEVIAKLKRVESNPKYPHVQKTNIMEVMKETLK